MSETEGILEKFAEWYVNAPSAKYLTITLVVVVILIPMFIPLGLPLGVNEFVKGYYNEIEKLPAGSVVLYAFEYGGGAAGTHILTYDTFRQMIRKNLKIIAFGVHEPIINPIGQEVFETIDWDAAGYVYGEDYVWLGWLPGEETVVTALYTDFRGQITYDFYGTSASELPLIQSIADHNDIDLLIATCDYGHIVRLYTRQWPSEPGRALIGSFPMEWYPHIVKGMAGGMLAAAQYEYLIGRPGKAIKGTDVTSVAQIYYLSLMVLANVAYLVRRKERKVEGLRMGKKEER